MKRVDCLCAALFCTLLARPVMAQEVPPLRLLVESLGHDAEICKVDEAGIAAAARSAARYNNITLENNSPYTLYINVTIIDAGQSCASHIRAEVNSYRTVQFGKKNSFPKVLFCYAGATGYYPKGVVMSRVSDYVKQAIERCIAEL